MKKKRGCPNKRTSNSSFGLEEEEEALRRNLDVPTMNV
jgi:hypothetical protein